MRLVDSAAVAASLVDALGLDSSIYAESSDEVLACAIRRVAAMSCPCARRSIVRDVVGSLESIVAGDDLRERVDGMIDGLVGHGDLVELRSSDDEFERASWLLHPAPPAFVLRESGSVILLGVAPDEIFPLPGGLQRRIQYRGYVRILEEDSSGNLPGYLADFGLLELKLTHWLNGPPRASANDVVRAIDAQLDVASRAAGDIPDLSILDWSTPVAYYPARWVEPKRQTGRFIARRPQAYGAPLWSYVELEAGMPGRLLDLPRGEFGAHGRDEAWRIQAAIDAVRGHPQRFRRRDVDGGAILDFFAPLPRWADRRFAVFGEAAPRRRCLFSHRFQLPELDEELAYIRDELWLEELKEG